MCFYLHMLQEPPAQAHAGPSTSALLILINFLSLSARNCVNSIHTATHWWHFFFSLMDVVMVKAVHPSAARFHSHPWLQTEQRGSQAAIASLGYNSRTFLILLHQQLTECEAAVLDRSLLMADAEKTNTKPVQWEASWYVLQCVWCILPWLSQDKIRSEG